MTDIREIPRLTHPCGDCLYQDICGHCETIMALAPEYPLDVAIECELKEHGEHEELANDLPETCEPLAEPVPEKKKRALSHKTCVDCGGKFESGPRGRRCPECRKKHKAQEPERRKAQRAKQRNQAPGQPAPEPEPEPPKLGDKDYGARQLARSGWLLAEYGTCDLAKIRKIEEEREKNAEDCQRTP